MSDEPPPRWAAKLARTRAWDLGDPDAQTTADLDLPRGSGAPAAAPVPIAPPAAPSGGSAGYRGAAGYGGAAAYPGFPLEGPGPGVLARFGSVLLCLGLTGLSTALLVFGVIGAVVEAQAALTGAAGTGAPILLIAGSVIAMFGAALTGRISGLGPVLAGVLLLVLSGLTLAFPHLLVSVLRSGLESGPLPVDGPLGDIVGGVFDDAVTAVLTSAGALVATMGLMMGAALLAVGMAVHGARRSGWRRGSGR